MNNLQLPTTMTPQEPRTEAVGIWTAAGVCLVIGLLAAVPVIWVAREALLALGIAQ